MPDPLRLSFDLPFEEAIAAARARKVVLPKEYYGDIPAASRRVTVAVSGLAGLDQAQAVMDSLNGALANGQTLREWQRWAAQQSWGLPKHRLETIFRTNVQTAYSAGHWRSFQEHKDRRPYLMYSAINDSRVRPSHLAMDGYIAPVDDPIWQTHSPPMGFNCRCGLLSLSEKEAIARGYGRQQRPTVQPDKGFGGGEPGNPASGVLSSIERRQSECKTFGFAGRRTKRPIHCEGKGKERLDQYEGLLRSDGKMPEPRQLNLQLLPTNLSERAYLEQFMARLVEGAEVPDNRTTQVTLDAPTGHRLLLSPAMFENHKTGETKIFKRDRAPYLLYLAETILTPDEVWLQEGSFGDRTLRLVSRFQRGRDAFGMLAVFSEHGTVWEGWTGYPIFRPAYLQSKRHGTLLYSRNVNGG